jgi:L-threonylcarbamoyladenylate synthase
MRADVISADRKDARRLAVEVLRAGGLVAFPTDTVYGLAALPWDTKVVARLYEVKQRPSDRPIPLLLSGGGQLDRVTVRPPEFDSQLARLVDRFWPGALTLVLPKAPVVSDVVSAGSTVAVRVPGLPLACDLIRDAGGVLAVTSANLSGHVSPVTAQEVEEELGERIELILNGGTSPGGVPSTILDCTLSPPELLRHGAVSEATLRAIIGPIKVPEVN